MPDTPSSIPERVPLSPMDGLQDNNGNEAVDTMEPEVPVRRGRGRPRRVPTENAAAGVDSRVEPMPRAVVGLPDNSHSLRYNYNVPTFDTNMAMKVNIGNFENQDVGFGFNNIPVDASQEYLELMVTNGVQRAQFVLNAMAGEMRRVLTEEYGR